MINVATLQAHANIFADSYSDVIEYVTDISHPQVLDPTLTQNLNMAFMESTVEIDDNKWDIIDIKQEWTAKFFEFSQSWSYSKMLK